MKNIHPKKIKPKIRLHKSYICIINIAKIKRQQQKALIQQKTKTCWYHYSLTQQKTLISMKQKQKPSNMVPLRIENKRNKELILKKKRIMSLFPFTCSLSSPIFALSLSLSPMVALRRLICHYSENLAKPRSTTTVFARNSCRSFRLNCIFSLFPFLLHGIFFFFFL